MTLLGVIAGIVWLVFVVVAIALSVSADLGDRILSDALEDRDRDWQWPKRRSSGGWIS